jgi:hypothetical protein
MINSFLGLPRVANLSINILARIWPQKGRHAGFGKATRATVGQWPYRVMAQKKPPHNDARGKDPPPALF